MRTNWYREMSDSEFRIRFRFSKENAKRLTDLVRPSLENPDNKGRPLSPEQIVLTGGQFLNKTHALVSLLLPDYVEP